MKVTPNHSMQLLFEIARDPNRTIGGSVFKSLGLIPGPASEGISDFVLSSDTTGITIYSSPIELEPDENDTTYLTNFRFTGQEYTYVERHRSSSEFATIAEFENFDISSGETIIDPLAGITTVFSIEQLQDFFEENRSILINSAAVAFDFKSEAERDTLTRFMNFFRKRDETIFWTCSSKQLL